MFKFLGKRFQILYIENLNRHISVSSVILKKISAFDQENKSSKYDNRQKSLDFSFETEQLFKILPEITEKILNEQLIYGASKLPELKERYAKFLNYTLYLDPKFLSRAIFTVHAYRLLEKSQNLTEENIKKACILGWCNKLIDASINIDDDIADVSDLRYGKPTWYNLVGVGSAVLDAAFLTTGCDFLLMNNLFDHSQYYNIHRTLLKSYAYTNVVQTVEIKRHKLQDLEKYENYSKMFMFTQPIVASALYLANITQKDIHAASDNLCFDIARLIKIDDDVKGVMSPQSDSLKECTDIPEGRPTWLIIEANRRGSKAQRKVLEEHYGKDNTDSIAKVYEIFKDLRLDEVYEEFRKEFYEDTYVKIHNLPKRLPPQLYMNLLDQVLSGSYRI